MEEIGYRTERSERPAPLPSSASATTASVSRRFFAPPPSSRREITDWVVPSTLPQGALASPAAMRRSWMKS